MRNNSTVQNTGKYGSVGSIKAAGGERQDIERIDGQFGGEPDPEKTASVGLSLTAGQTTAFARQKLEVTAWCTLPCKPDPQSIQEAYNACYEFVESTVKQRSMQAIETFFPDMLGDSDGI